MRALLVLLSLGSALFAGCMQAKEAAIVLFSPISKLERPSGVKPTRERIASLRLPPGYGIEVFAEGLGAPRMMATLSDGTVLVTRPDEGDVLSLRDGDGDGVVDQVETVLSGLKKVHGIAVREGRVFLVGAEVWTAELADSKVGPVKSIFGPIPVDGRHDKHTLNLGPDGKLYVSVGSSCDACEGEHPLRARILRMGADGTGMEVFAEGLRDVKQFDWHPATGELWAMDMGSDHRGDNLPPEELNRIVRGGHYGWPFAYGKRAVDMLTVPPSGGLTKEAFAAQTLPSVMEYQAHASPIGFLFYRGDQFPAASRGDAFVAMHGSWNRDPPSGYEVVRIRFENGQPVAFEPFVSGWLLPGGGERFGRPAGLAELPDGSLLISDDAEGVIYRVRYMGAEAARPG